MRKRWKIFVCSVCGKRHGGAYWCRCQTPARRAQAIEVVPAADRVQLRQQVEERERRLAACYRLTGSDPDGDSDSMLAKHAVDAVRELREEADKAGEWEERAVLAEQRLAHLLGKVDDHRNESLPTSTPQKFSLDGELYAAADQVRKELGEG